MSGLPLISQQVTRLVDPRFSKDNFKALPNDVARMALGRELAKILEDRMQAAMSFGAEARRCVDELRELGHDLWSFDDDDEYQSWCPNYTNPTGPGIIVTFAAPYEVTVEWSQN
jgi:hypothetical protein